MTDKEQLKYYKEIVAAQQVNIKALLTLVAVYESKETPRE